MVIVHGTDRVHNIVLSKMPKIIVPISALTVSGKKMMNEFKRLTDERPKYISSVMAIFLIL